VTPELSAPVNASSGGNATAWHVSAYELYTADFGSSADKVFAVQDAHPFVAGEFVWSGWDYLGEPTPWYGARSSYFGIVDLAGFRKDRWWLYQARWRPDLKVLHVLPHWSWPERVNVTTPVHVFSNAESVEVWVNGVSQGRKMREGKSQFRFRWDEVRYVPGEVKAVGYGEDGEEWATEIVKTAGEAAKLEVEADRTELAADGQDLSFVSVKVVDKEGLLVPRASNQLVFEVEGPAELVATDNGDPTDFTVFPSRERKAFNGLALGILRTKEGEKGKITLSVSGKGVKGAKVELQAQ
jgi:beta-galactosidase